MSISSIMSPLATRINDILPDTAEKTPGLAQQAPRPMRLLTPSENAAVQYRLNQMVPVRQKGFDIPTVNLIASPQKQAALGGAHGALVGYVVSALLMDTIYKFTSTGNKVVNVVLGTALAGGLAAMRRYKKTHQQNAFAINLMQHGVTQYDSIPRGISINPNAWKQLNGIG